jgi:hypothetical protein
LLNRSATRFSIGFAKVTPGREDRIHILKPP